MKLSDLKNKHWEREDHNWDSSHFQASIQSCIFNVIRTVTVQWYEVGKYSICVREIDELTGQEIREPIDYILSDRKAIERANLLAGNMGPKSQG